MTCEKGRCLVCGKEIAKKCETCGGSWKNNAEYCHVQLSWSNGSRMDVAVCVGCSKDAVWKADKALMTKAIHDAWDEMGATYDKTVVMV
jgi:hypothetical protein